MEWLRNKIWLPLLELLRQGTSPRLLALCVAIGLVVGIVPILGVSTALCALIAYLARLNGVAIQLAQASVAPLQLLLILPFLRLGEWLLGAAPQPMSFAGGMAILQQGPVAALSRLSSAIWHAGLAWLLLAPFLVLGAYAVLYWVFTQGAAQIEQRRRQPAAHD